MRSRLPLPRWRVVKSGEECRELFTSGNALFVGVPGRLVKSEEFFINLLSIWKSETKLLTFMLFSICYRRICYAVRTADCLYICQLACVLRQNEVLYWLYLMDSVLTSKEMVADPPHSACRCWLQTTLCCSDGNWWVVNDNWKSSVRLARYVSRRWTQVNHWWSIVSKFSKSHQNQGVPIILG